MQALDMESTNTNQVKNKNRANIFNQKFIFLVNKQETIHNNNNNNNIYNKNL